MVTVDPDGSVIVDRVGKLPTRLRFNRMKQARYRGITFAIQDFDDDTDEEKKVLVDAKTEEMVFSSRIKPEEVLNEIDRILKDRSEKKKKEAESN